MKKIDMARGFGLAENKRVHFIGIGGVSMSSLAEILLENGYTVSGSDKKHSDITEKLSKDGINIFFHHSETNITDDIGLVVYTAAVTAENPEMVAAARKGIKIIDRATLLGYVMRHFQHPVCIAGSHGKTSTTGMVSEILIKAGKNPSVAIGGYYAGIDGNYRLTDSEYFAVEACEYFDSFLKFFPRVGVILNVDSDHLDYFKNFETIVQSFHKFAGNIAADGVLIINASIACRDKITDGLACRVVTYGENGDWSYEGMEYDEMGKPSFYVTRGGERLGRVKLSVPGLHNAENALAAMAACYETGLPVEDIFKGIEVFGGTRRRLEYKGKFGGVTVMDDYAHHPTAIKAALATCRKSSYNNVWCIFQPHTYSRTYELLTEFSEAFDDADRVIVVDIYSARENNTGLVHSLDLAEKLNERGKLTVYGKTPEAVRQLALKNCLPGDVLITIGAGDVYLLGEMLL